MEISQNASAKTNQETIGPQGQHISVGNPNPASKEKKAWQWFKGARKIPWAKREWRGVKLEKRKPDRRDQFVGGEVRKNKGKNHLTRKPDGKEYEQWGQCVPAMRPKKTQTNDLKKEGKGMDSLRMERSDWKVY